MVNPLQQELSPQIESPKTSKTTTPPSSPKTDKQLKEEKEFLDIFEKAIDDHNGDFSEDDFDATKIFFNSNAGKKLNTLHKFKENIVGFAKKDEVYKKAIKVKQSEEDIKSALRISVISVMNAWLPVPNPSLTTSIATILYHYCCDTLYQSQEGFSSLIFCFFFSRNSQILFNSLNFFLTKFISFHHIRCINSRKRRK